MCSRSRNNPTQTTASVLIGSTEAKSRSRFSLNSAAAIWRSRRTTTNRAELSIAAETSSYVGKVGANLRGGFALAHGERILGIGGGVALGKILPKRLVAHVALA